MRHLLGPLCLTVLLAQTEAQSAEPVGLPDAVVSAWKGAGAESGWVVWRQPGQLDFVTQREQQTGLPGFRLKHCPPGLLRELPRPAAEFGLVLQGDRIDNEVLKELGRLKRLRYLGLEDTQVNAEGLKALVGLRLRELVMPRGILSDSGLSCYLAALDPVRRGSSTWTMRRSLMSACGCWPGNVVCAGSACRAQP